MDALQPGESKSLFPILLSPSLYGLFTEPPMVEWDFVEPHREQAMINHGMTLEKLAVEGGLCFTDLLAVLEGRYPYGLIAEEKAMKKVEILLLKWRENV